MQSPTTSDQASRTLSPERWVQAFIAGRTDISTIPPPPHNLLRAARQWLSRWKGLTRPERLRVVELLGHVGDDADGEQLLRLGEGVEDDPNVASDWRETVLSTIDEAFGGIEARARELERLAPASG
ncbi:MAG: hypothetical protein H7338_10635 [Candidatus Sericytochromatia bacterium]|nr:hypothetical protein [Candidatus Sericytochromatia bacterium]